MLRLENIRKQFGAQIILDGANLAVNPGERVGLIGPNGTGKTTLFGIIEGIEGVDGGSVSLIGRVRLGVLRQELEASERPVLEEVLEGDQELIRLQREQETLHMKMAKAACDTEQERLSLRLGEVDHQLERVGAYDARARASAILMGLGFSREEIQQPLSRFSGGWRMRASLARLLFSSPGLLLLDEPTNHLDIESVAWLEKFLARFPGTLIVISHDRHFLNRVAGVIVELDRGRLTRYTGNFDSYLEQREAMIGQLEKAAAQQERRIAELERFINRFRAKATKARQAQSRIRQLEKLKPVERIVRPSAAPRIRLPEPPASAREALSAEGLGKSFGAHHVFSKVNLKLIRGEKIGLLGPNGAGKTTFLHLITGGLKPTAGRVRRGDRVRVGHFSQVVMDSLDASKTVLDSAREIAPPALGNTDLRSLLGGFLFPGEDAFKKVAVLSGGERARLALALLFLSGANLLLLDEPTNHLDMGARAALEEALEGYAGTFILVAHDRDLLESVCESYWVVEEGTIRPLRGSLDDYLEGTAAKRQGEKSAGKESAAPQRKDREMRRQAAEARNQAHRETRGLRKKSEVLEANIRKLEAEQDELNCLLADPGLYEEGNKAKLAKTLERHREVSAAIQSRMEEWEKVATAIEEIEAAVRAE
ncbi:MAG: ABC-F family ATP-binding cassette domain-containing protein [Nitrospinota bacterium]